MADNTELKVAPYAVYLPDQYSETEVREGASWPLGAGHYEFGFESDGARFPLARIKAGGVQKKLAAAKASKSKTDTAEQSA
jgi:hypothetical protein